MALSEETKREISTAYQRLRDDATKTEKWIEEHIAGYLSVGIRTVRRYKKKVFENPISNHIEDLEGVLTPPLELVEIGGFAQKIESLTSEDFTTRQPKILLLDLETAPNTAYIWAHYEQNALKHLRQWYILAFCAKWIGGETVSKCLPDYEGYQPNTDNDKALVSDLWNLFNQADVIIAHNGDAFDIKKTNARFLIHGFNPPSPYKSIDTKKIARRYFRFNSNKLDDLGNTLGVGRKMKHTGFELWDDCINGDLEAWELMRMYNRQDVLLLERVYERLKPYMTNHPNMAILSEIKNGCPVCSSTNLNKSGFSITATGKKERFQCLDCGAWGVGNHKKVTDIR
jgi:DNA polymerase elongation subunit (family B)